MPAGAARELLLPARRAGCALVWEVEPLSGGVEFSAALRDAEGRIHCLEAPRKLRAEDGRTVGRVEVLRAGTVQLRFCNSHSRFHSKALRVTATVFDAEDGSAEGLAEGMEALAVGEKGESCAGGERDEQ